jgi:hypothetical protein
VDECKPLLAGLNALSTFHPEQNPALQAGGVIENNHSTDVDSTTSSCFISASV